MTSRTECKRVPMKAGWVASLVGVATLFGCRVDAPRHTPIEMIDVGATVGLACPDEEEPRPLDSRSMVLDQTGDFPCRVQARRTGVVLKPSVDASRPDPSWTSVARDSRGRFYTAATNATGQGTILVWSSDGTFQRTVGRSGEGPGELSGRGLLAVFIGPGDSLFVREGHRWSVFSPDHTFGRVINAAAIQGRSRFAHVTSFGTFLTTAQAGGEDEPFQLADGEGNVIRSFGSRNGLEMSPGAFLGSRPSAYSGGSSFWAAPPPGAPDGYLLEEWSLDGELVRTIERDVPWITDRATSGRTVVPQFSRLHIDPDGNLWVLIVVKDPRWRPLRRGEDAEAMRSEMYDLRYEVLDPEGARVLVSGVIDEFPDESERNVPPVALFLPGSALSYRPVPDSLGFQSIEILELHLVENR